MIAKKAFTLIEILVSLLIMTVLLGVGFYSLRNYESTSGLQSSADELKQAIETARNYSIALPKTVGNDITAVKYVGVEITSNTTLTTYQLFYYKDVTSGSCTAGNWAVGANCTKVNLGETKSLQNNVAATNNYTTQDTSIKIIFEASNASARGSMAGFYTTNSLYAAPSKNVRLYQGAIGNSNIAKKYKSIVIVPATGLVLYEN